MKKYSRKQISGYRKCLNCSVEFPFRVSLKVRGFNGIAHATQKYCSHPCSLVYRNKTIENRSKVSKSLSGRPSKLQGVTVPDERRYRISVATKGEKHWNWKGGISPKNNAERSSIELKEWRRSVFSRDKFTCQTCGYKGKGLEADHIKPWAYFPELRFIVSNGRTLCKPCHQKTPTYKGRTNFTSLNTDMDENQVAPQENPEVPTQETPETAPEQSAPEQSPEQSQESADVPEPAPTESAPENVPARDVTGEKVE